MPPVPYPSLILLGLGSREQIRIWNLLPTSPAWGGREVTKKMMVYRYLDPFGSVE
jgi:hypothetical protein